MITRSLLCLAASILWAPSAFSASFDLTLAASHRITTRAGGRSLTLLLDLDRNARLPAYDTSTYLAAQPLETYYSLFAEAGIDAALASWITVRLVLNSGEVREQRTSLDGTTRLVHVVTVNGRLVLDELPKNAFVRTALIDLHAPETTWWQLELGHKLWRLGNSFIFDEWALGVQLSLDFELLNGRPWRLDLSYIVPTRDFADKPWTSPLATVRLEYKLSLFESVWLSFSWFRDGAGEITETVRQAAVERVLNADFRPLREQATLACYLNTDFRSAGNLFYATIAGNKTLGPGSLRATLVFEAGRVLIQGAPVFRTDCTRTDLVAFTTIGAAFDVSYRWSATDRLAITPFIVAESGQQFSAGQRMYSAYIGVLPFITRTSLFFAGGLAETFGARRVTSAGVNGRGVVAPGVEAIYEPVDQLRLRAVVSPLFSWARGIEAPVGGGGQFYGVEIDSVVIYEPVSVLGFAAEADVLFGGSFYRTGEPVWKVIFSVDLSKTWTL